MINYDKGRLYDSLDDFFFLNGNIGMKLTASAAAGVCRAACEHGFYVAKIEGGIWHYPGFEARIDCIWNGADFLTNANEILSNNMAAEEFILQEKENHDVFVVTVMKSCCI